MNTHPYTRLGDMLVQIGLISQSQLQAAIEKQKHTSMRLGAILIESGAITDCDLIEAISLQTDSPFIRINDFEPPAYLFDIVPESIARAYNIFPISASETRLSVAMSNTLDLEAIDSLARFTGKRVVPVLTSKNGIANAIDKHYKRFIDTENIELSDEEAKAVEIKPEEQYEVDISEERKNSDQAPVIRAVNTILQEAVNQEASDIHLEPRASYMELRYRIDGRLHQIENLPKRLQSAIVSRIKILANMDIAEKRKPQDGRISAKLMGRNIDLRISSLPVQYGERIVIRILDKENQNFSVDKLGFSDEDQAKYLQLITKPYGLILVTGPTGSGKTTTLYSALQHITDPATNIMTCEDPIEYDMEGINQSQVNPRAGLTFATQLRAILRQDPDVVLIGEIRDVETAEIAFQAAITGHLVFSTLHCNDAPSSITRLLDMEVEPFLISSSVIGAISQRLVRTLCPECKAPYSPSSEDLALLAGQNVPDNPVFYKPMGCTACDMRGYRGRMAVAEMMLADSEIRKLTMHKATAEEIRMYAAGNGMLSMQDYAMQRVLEGMTTFDEVRRQVFVQDDF